MIDHLTLPVSDFHRAVAFYRAALAPLGYELVMQISREHVPDLPVAHTAGLGVKGKPDFWLRPTGPDEALVPIHLAFAAEDRKQVDAFYRAALAVGAHDNGAPGLRPHYHAGYYGGFVLDADGHNIEAVCHRPE